MLSKKNISSLFLLIIMFLAISLSGCTDNGSDTFSKEVPKDSEWGIYALDLETEEIKLVYKTDSEISTLRLNNAGDKFVFSQRINGKNNSFDEICTLDLTGENFRQLTNNTKSDVYPAWSPDGTQIAFISMDNYNYDIYLMNSDGTNPSKLYNSGFHDADIHWVGNYIVFTASSKIWRIGSDGTNETLLTNPTQAGELGNANLPFGDYNPRISPDGSKVVFERLEEDNSKNGNYNIYTMKIDGTGEESITNTSYFQGFASWSNSGTKLVFIVSAIKDETKYDIYTINIDGTDNKNITPDYFTDDFLCHSPIFSFDDSEIYFVGQWHNFSSL